VIEVDAMFNARSGGIAATIACAALLAGWILPQQGPVARPKLGEVHHSPLMGGAANPQGKRFELNFLAEGARLEAITVCTEPGRLRLIASMRFRYRDAKGEAREAVVGSGGECHEEYVVASGARLAGIRGAGGWYVDRLQFQFTDGAQSPEYGGTGGDHEFELTLRKKAGRYMGRVIGMWGTMDGRLESVGLVYWPEE
jgi:hypothetical protein